MKQLFKYLRLICTLVLAIYAFSCKQQIKPHQRDPNKDLGIGYVGISHDSAGNSFSVQLYNDFEAKQKAFLVSNALWESNPAGLDSKILFVNPDLPGYCFRCMADSGNMYQIVVDDSAGKMCWVKKESNVGFGTWDDFFTGFDDLSTDDTLYTMPDEKAPIISNPDSCYSFSMLQLKGDWAELEMDSDRCAGYLDIKITHTIKGWVKWKRGNKITIGYGFNE